MKASEWRRLKGLPPAGADRERKRAAAQTETELTIAVADWLRALRGLEEQCVWTHVANERSSKGETVRSWRMGTLAGVADFVFWLPKGETLAIELKTEGGRLSPHQHHFRKQLEGFGHPYRICRSLEEVKEALESCSVTVNEPPLARAMRRAR